MGVIPQDEQEVSYPMSKHTECAERAEKIIRDYTPGVTDDLDVDPHTAITDLIADLLHLAHAKGLEPEAVIDSARLHFEGEEPGHEDAFAAASELSTGSPLPDPPPHLANAWERFQRGGAGGVTSAELRDLDEWRADCAEDAGF